MMQATIYSHFVAFRACQCEIVTKNGSVLYTVYDPWWWKIRVGATEIFQLRLSAVTLTHGSCARVTESISISSTQLLLYVSPTVSWFARGFAYYYDCNVVAVATPNASDPECLSSWSFSCPKSSSLAENYNNNYTGNICACCEVSKWQFEKLNYIVFVNLTLVGAFDAANGHQIAITSNQSSQCDSSVRRTDTKTHIPTVNPSKLEISIGAHSDTGLRETEGSLLWAVFCYTTSRSASTRFGRLPAHILFIRRTFTATQKPTIDEESPIRCLSQMRMSQNVW